MILDALVNDSKASGSLISDIATIVSAVVWPLLILIILIWFRKSITELTKAAVAIATSASKVKIWQIEFDRDVRQQLESSAEAALKSSQNQESLSSSSRTLIRTAELQAASKVNQLVVEAPSLGLKGDLLDSIRERMIGLAQEYDATRANMQAGHERTRAMNVIAAKMRTLGLAAIPFLEEFSNDKQSPGKRLAAICILQMGPDLRYLSWLCDRMNTEQPFVFYHASAALLNMVRKFGSAYRDELRPSIERALQVVTSFKGEPDQNTVGNLQLALSELDSAKPA